jgi:LysR family transcriptional activator of nhaA
MFNFNHLYYFYITAKSGGVTAAAHFLNTSQSSLSIQLKTLEESLDKQLFHKVGRNIELTPDGQVVFGFCRRSFEATDELADFLKSSGESKGQRFAIGVSDDIERPFVTEILGKLLKGKAGKNQPLIRMTSSTKNDLMAKLSLNELDVVLTSQPTYGDEIENACELNLPVVLIGPPKLFGLLKNVVSQKVPSVLKELDCGLVLPSSDLHLRYEIDKFLQKGKIKKNIVFESNILASVARALADGAGVGFLPLPYIQRELKQEVLKVCGPSDGLWDHKLFLMTTKRHMTMPIVIELSNHLKAISHN